MSLSTVAQDILAKRSFIVQIEGNFVEFLINHCSSQNNTLSNYLQNKYNTVRSANKNLKIMSRFIQSMSFVFYE